MCSSKDTLLIKIGAGVSDSEFLATTLNALVLHEGCQAGGEVMRRWGMAAEFMAREVAEITGDNLLAVLKHFVGVLCRQDAWTPNYLGGCQNYGPFLGVHIKSDIDIDVDMDTNS